MDWDTLKAECLACRRCELCTDRTHVVFGQGVQTAEVLFVGEGPGQSEDEQGLPFVGRSGQLLDKYLAAIHLKREDIFITNIVKCRPPENRNPLPEEKAACREYLDIQVGALKPRIILLCGNIAVQSFMEGAKGITKVRGQWFDGPYGSKMMPIFHPSYLLRNESRAKGSPKWLMWQDIQEIKRAYDDIKD